MQGAGRELGENLFSRRGAEEEADMELLEFLLILLVTGWLLGDS